VTSPRNSQPPSGPSRPDDALEPGTVLNERYRIDALLGEGAMGKVYAAEHVLLRKKVAVKLLRGDRALVPEVVARFEREAMAAANVEHPNIAGASDFGRLADGSVYLVLEYVQGKNLRDEIAKGPLPLARSLHIARQIASALAGAAALEIVHRDLKPENVMLVEKLGDRDFVKVLDFGIARVPMAETDQRLTKTGIVFGTPEYMAPEQALGQRVDGRADLYALGVILFEMVAGVRPYPDGSRNPALRLAQRPPRLAERAPGIEVPAALEAVIQKLLAASVKNRFPSAVELLVELDTLLAGEPRPSAAPMVPPPSPSGGTPGERGERSAPAVRKPTFLPGDPLPAFDLPEISESEIHSSPPDARTLLRAPKHDSSAPPSPPPAPVSAVEEGPAAPGTATIQRSITDFVDAHRHRLPRFVRRRVKRVPATTLAAAGAGLAVLVVLGFVLALVALFRGPASGEAARQPASRAEAVTSVAAAPQRAADSLPAGASAAPAPSDPSALVDQARARLEQKDEKEALALLGRALAADAKLAEDERVAALLRELLRSTNAASVDGVFVLLEGTMGQRGAELIYDAALDAKLPERVRTRANAWLRTKEFDRASSPALFSAVRLRLASSCEQKFHWLKHAENVGGKQTLEYLRELSKLTQCRPNEQKDCYACLENEGRLQQTIVRLERRLGS
jgi:serine/threonine-protein kinase